MEEPLHAQENRFWDRVADWLLDPHCQPSARLSDEDIEAILRATEPPFDQSASS